MKRKKKTHEEIEREQALKTLIRTSNAKTSGDFRDLMATISQELLNTMLKEEFDNHLGYAPYNLNQKTTSNSRNGTSSKTLKSDFGNLSIVMPRDRDSSFNPVVIPKGSRILGGMEEQILHLYAMGVTQRDICSFANNIYGCEISPEAISSIVDSVSERVTEWRKRPLKEIYSVIFMDAIRFNMRMNGHVRNIAVNVLLGIDLEGKKNVLGFWISENESAKFWLSILNELKSRGVKDALFFCVDGLRGFSDAIKAVYPESEVQRCIVHQVRYCTRHVNYKDRRELCADMKKVYKADNEDQALIALDELAEKWDNKYPYISKSWRNNWNELAVIFKYPNEIRRLIYTTNAIESLNSVLRKYTKSREAFMNEMSLYKIIYLAVEKITYKWRTAINNWGLIFSQLNIIFPERLEKYIK